MKWHVSVSDTTGQLGSAAGTTHIKTGDIYICLGRFPKELYFLHGDECAALNFVGLCTHESLHAAMPERYGGVSWSIIGMLSAGPGYWEEQVVARLTSWLLDEYPKGMAVLPDHSDFVGWRASDALEGRHWQRLRRFWRSWGALRRR